MTTKKTPTTPAKKGAIPKTQTAKVTAIDKATARLNKSIQNASAIVSRASMASALGYSFDGDRDIYKALGYPTVLSFKHFASRYARQDIAHRIIDIYPNATWREPPEVYERDKKDAGATTDFEAAWNRVVEDMNIYHYLSRVDKLAGIGQYAILLLGFNDGESDMAKPVGKASELLYLAPYSQDSATIKSWNTDTQSSRFGKPELYAVKMTIGVGSEGEGTLSKEVHWSRLIHVADGLLENEVLGTPRLEPIYNRLMNLELLTGGSAEMFWRGAFPGFGFLADSEADFTTQDREDLADEMDNYTHGLQRYLRMQGIDIKQLAPQVASPKQQVDVQIDMISGATGIPKRILVGSERGELASSQDETNWNSRVGERRNGFATPMVLRPIITRLIEAGILPAPKNGFDAVWPEVNTLSDTDKADVINTKTEALAKYADSGADTVLPRTIYLRDILGYDEEGISEIEAEMGQDMDEADREDVIDEDEAGGEDENESVKVLEPPEDGDDKGDDANK